MFGIAGSFLEWLVLQVSGKQQRVIHDGYCRYRDNYVLYMFGISGVGKLRFMG